MGAHDYNASQFWTDPRNSKVLQLVRARRI